LIEEIKKQIESGSYRFTIHGFERCVERGISPKETEDVILSGEIIEHYPDDKPCCCIKFGAWIHPVRNNAPLLPPGQAPPRKGSCPGGRPSGPAAAAGFNTLLKFLTGFIKHLPREGWLSNQCRHLDQINGDPVE